MTATVAAVRRLDDLLFHGPYTLIDRDNRGVGTTITRAAAEHAVATGRAATYAGRVRADVTAIDIDVDHGGLGDWLVGDLRDWARRRGAWCIAHASGGGGGRRHVFVRQDRSSADLAERLQLLRDDLHLTTAQIAARPVIRPLTAPHRRTGPTPVTGVRADDVAAAAAWPPPRPVPRRPPAIAEPAPDAGAPSLSSRVHAVVARAVASATGDRSVDEFALTRDLHNQGETAQTAWAAVASLHGKSLERGHRWWHRHMWSRIRPPQTTEATPTVDLAVLILPTIAALRPRLTDLGVHDVRAQHTLENVCWAVLERLQAAPDGWLPLSERDLQLATGHDRKTIRKALERLQEAEVLTHRRGHRVDDAKEWQLGPSAVRSLNPPPRLTPCARTWLPAAPAGTATHTLDHHLNAPEPAHRQLSFRQRTFCTQRDQVAQTRALLTPHPDLEAPAAPNPQPPASSSHSVTDAFRAARARLLERITAERDAFYTALRAHRQTRDDAWCAQRHAAYRADQTRQRRWWRNLSPHQRQLRRQDWRTQHAQRPTEERCLIVERLRQRRAIRAALPPTSGYGATIARRS